MMVQKRSAERGAGNFDRSLNFSGHPQNEENPRISRIAVYHCICTAPYMIRKGGGFPEHWLDLMMLYMSSATLLMSIFLPNFAASIGFRLQTGNRKPNPQTETRFVKKKNLNPKPKTGNRKPKTEIRFLKKNF